LRLTTAPAFRGRFTLPGDKSLSHRMALLGALADGETRIGNYSTAADCESTLRCLESLGVEVRREQRSVSVLGAGPDGLSAAPGPLDAGNSGSTLRMLAGVLAGRPFRTVVTGDASLCRRPAERVATPLRAMGARVETTDGRPPMSITGGDLRGVTWDLAVPSAQVKTAILLAGLQAEGTTTVRETLPSRDHTERLLPLFGVPLEVAPDAVSVRRQDALRPAVLEVPGDVSSAAFLVVAALIVPDSEVRIDRVLLNPRRTAFLDVLRAMGGDLRTGVDETTPEHVGWIEARSSRLEGVRVAPEIVPGLIDELPALAVAAVHARGTFTVSGASELRVKESDRIAALAEGLGRMGAAVDEHPDGFTVHGGRRLEGAVVTGQGDHRIAMALAVAALAAEGETEIVDAACASVSFPEFYDVLARGCEQGRHGRG
jgi:3-phosphoshikimate 1-carboxyvinyltransferase